MSSWIRPTTALAPLAVALAVTSLAATSLRAQEFGYLAFGDSITAGSFDEAGLGGYPGRLPGVLGCSPGVCSVDNKGVGGELSGEGLTRIGGLINSGKYDVVLLMEGTNDIFNNISNNTIKFNLETMASIATNGGVDTVIASIIWFHPDGCHGTSKDDEVEDLKNKVGGIAGGNSYYFANPWEELCKTSTCFDQHYFDGIGCPGNPDPVGHPDASGYDILTDVWADKINSVPVPGTPSPTSPSGQGNQSPANYAWDRESPVRATWYQVEVDGPGGNLLQEWYQAAEVCGATSCTIKEQLNLGNGSYSWRVRGRNPKGRSSFSPPLDFSIQPPGPGPTLTLLSGSCAAAPSGAHETAAPNAVTILGENFPSKSEVGLVMAAGNEGFVKGGTLCNGASFEISEPFVLPPTWVKTDSSGSFTVQLSGEQCFVQSLAVKSCEVSNLLVLP